MCACMHLIIACVCPGIARSIYHFWRAGKKAICPRSSIQSQPWWASSSSSCFASRVGIPWEHFFSSSTWTEAVFASLSRDTFHFLISLLSRNWTQEINDGRTSLRSSAVGKGKNPLGNIYPVYKIAAVGKFPFIPLTTQQRLAVNKFV